MVRGAGTSLTPLCPECGRQLSHGPWVEGLCPHCLLGLALTSSSAEEPLPSETEATLEFPSEAAGGELSHETLASQQILGDRYQVRSLLGRGGMGEVWQAYDLKLRVDVALKALRVELLADESPLELLRQEVRSAREVISPNVCRVFDLEELDGQELVSMEYIDGTTLLEILKSRGPLELGEAREIASQFLAGLEAIHDAGLVHRDVKPENLMITRAGRVVVMDFGIAKGLAERNDRTIAGTPAYMAQEQSKGEVVDARADVFSAGVVMTEMIAPEGIRDREARQTLWRAVHHEPPELPDTPWTAVLRKAVARDREKRYPTASALARALEEVALRVEGAEELFPYPGLAAFTEEDAEYFFGRELEVEAMWKKLRRPHLLALIGPSGAGKSSFLRAGLIPTMPEGWRALIATPGSRPFMALAQPLVGEFAGDTEATSGLLRFEEPDIAVSLMTRWRQGQKHALVIVDQFEELFTQNPPEVQERFAELLRRLALEADIHVLLSMRDDFLFQCQPFEALSPIFSELTPLGVLGGSSLRRALVQPALKCGYRFEDEELVDEMVAEVEEERGALPLMAFAAARLWEKRDRQEGLLSREAYGEIGGVAGSLAQHAEKTLERIGSERIPIVRELFRNLVTAEGTRAARDREELLSVFESSGTASVPAGEGGEREAAAQVLDILIDARLLTSYELPPAEDEDTGHQKIEIIHESLLAAWPRLVRWQTQDVEGAQLRDELRQVAQMWDQHDRSADLLWTGTAFQEYQLWRDRYPGGLSELEEEFARAMESHAERRRRRRRIAVGTVITALLVVVGVIGGFWRRSVGEARRAEAANLFALAQLRLEEHPTAALAYAIGSLELADNPEVRLMVVDALWRGPTELRLATSSPFSVDFSPDGRWLSTANRAGGGQLWPADGGPPTLLEDSETIFEGRISPRGDVIAHNQPTEAKKIGLWTFPAGRFLRWLDLGGTYNQQFWFSPDGSRLITSTETLEGDDLDVEIRSWPIEGGDPDLVARLEASRESSATFFGVDPTESLLGWVDGTRFNIRPLAAGSAHPVSTITLEHGRAINSAVFDAEGEHVATADGVGTIRIWSLEQDPPELIRAVEAGGLLAPWSLRFDPSGMMVGAAGGYLGDLTAPPDAEWQRLRRAAGAIETETAEGGFSVAFHPESEWFATGHYYSVSLWPLARSYPRILQGHENNVRDVKFSPDGKWLVSSSTDGSVRQWPLEGNSNQRSKILYQAEGAFDTPYWLAMAPDGSFVATGTMNGAVWVLPLDGGPARELGTLDDLISSVAVGPRARLVAAGAGSDNRDEAAVRVWDLATGETRVLDAGDRKAIGRLAFTPQGDLVISSGSLLRLWDLQAAAPELREEIEISDSETPEGPLLGIHPELRRVLYRVEGRLWVYDMDARVARELDSQGREVGPAVFDTKGEVLVSTEKTGIIRVERGSGGEPHLLIGHEVSGVNSLDVSADGRWIASAGGDKTIRLWPMPDLEKPPLHTLPHDELLAKLRSLTNLRVVEDPGSPSGWKLEVGPFPGWEEVPTW